MTTWRDRVEDPNVLRWCACTHAEQHHYDGVCTVRRGGWSCICDEFVEVKRERVGL